MVENNLVNRGDMLSFLSKNIYRRELVCLNSEYDHIAHADQISQMKRQLWMH